ncbi:hypothetical protein F4821DRAFT_280217 [Hypoxylon rubiginosum]|uniref:Uncharacterized protein n=1 Tax=Hypoxylon rubiginosum TaxID=110542 RepID=A0ACC0DGI3_9PEZI|nr:hypothetical protein F4821DRAFT_280217 [Hypoxylon rubiginosum]
MSKPVADEEQPLRLSEDLLASQEPEVSPKRGILTIVTFPSLYTVFLHLVILILLIYTFRGSPYPRTQPPMPEGATWSPATEFIRYQINGDHALHQNKPSVYAGTPTVEQERAWDDLVTPAYFAATREELIKSEESLENGARLTSGGYLATLGVYHELHCLRQFRLYLYRDRYYENITEAQDHYLHQHLDHCLESLRLTIMCHGNTGLYTFAWTSASQGKPTSQSNARSVCVNWSSIKDWSHSREIPDTERVMGPSSMEDCHDC